MEPKEYVITLLKRRNKMSQESAALKYELEHFRTTDDDAVIQELTFSGGVEERSSTGTVPDRTADIALKFRQVADRINDEAFKAVVHRLDALGTAVERLDFYIGQLEQEQANVLRRYYFDRLTCGLQRHCYEVVKMVLNAIHLMLFCHSQAEHVVAEYACFYEF